MLLPRAAFAHADYAELEPTYDKNEKITQLQWTQTRPFLYKAFVKKQILYYVEIQGEYIPPTRNWTLHYGMLQIRPGKNGTFSLRVPIKQDKNVLEFNAIGPEGRMEKEKVIILVHNLDEIRKKDELERARAVKLFAGLGYSYIQYQQTSYANITETGVTAKISGIYPTRHPYWEFGGSLFCTAYPLTTNAHIRIWFLGVNARAGYVIPWINNPWKLSIMGGAYYATTYANKSIGKNKVGYHNVSGPQIFPVLSRFFQDGSSFGGYLKYSPVSSGFSFLSLSSNYEYGGGVQYTFEPFTSRKFNDFFVQHRLSLTFDMAQIKISSAVSTAQSKSFTLGASIGL